MRKLFDGPTIRGNGGGKVAGGILTKKDSRTKGTRPNTNPGPAGYETRTPLGAKTPIGKRLSKLARR